MSRATSITTDSRLELLGPRKVIPTDRDDLQEAIEMLPWFRDMAVKVGGFVDLSCVSDSENYPSRKGGSIPSRLSRVGAKGALIETR